jgi:hypothetical protein
MELDKLIIEISADSAEFVRALNQNNKALQDFGVTGTASADQVSKALKEVQKAALNTNDAVSRKKLVEAYIELNTELQRVKKEFKELTKIVPQASSSQDSASNSSKKLATGLGQVDESARRARIALYGANQIVRDLPFGFIAISNNIPVALDQFQQLIKDTGGVDKAFKSLGGAMLGAGGLSIAFSALTSLTVSLIQEYGSLANAINTIFNLVDKDTIALIKQKDAYAGVTAEIRGETSNISLLAATLTNAQSSNDARINSYNELKRIAPGVIQDIAFENTLTSESIGLIKDRSLELINYIQLKGRESALIKLIADEEEKGLKATQKLIRQLTGEGRTWVDTLSDITDAAIFQRPNAALENTSKEVINATKQTQYWSKSLEAVRKQILEFDGLVTGQVSFKDLIKEQQKAAKEQEQNTKKEQNNAKKSISEQLTSRINALKAEVDAKKSQVKNLNELSTEYVNLQVEIANKEYQIAVLNATRQIKNKQELNTALISLEQELEAKKANIINTAAAARFAAVDAELQKRKEAVQAELDFIDKTTNEVLGKPDIVNKRISESFKKLNDELKAQEDQQKKLLALAEQYADKIGDAVGNIVEGLFDGKKPLDLLVQGFKQLAVQIAVAYAKALAFKAITKALDVVVPGSGTAVSAGSSFLSALFNQRVPTNPIINPTAGLQFGAGGIQLQGSVVFTQRGTDLVGVLNSSNARINRVG